MSSIRGQYIKWIFAARSGVGAGSIHFTRQPGIAAERCTRSFTVVTKGAELIHLKLHTQAV